MGPSIFAKILSNPVEWLQSGRDRYRNKGISAADIRSGKVKFVTVKAKPDTVASHRTWEWMQYLVQQLADQGIEAEVLCPQLFLPAEGYVRGFYTAEGHKKVMPLILSHLLGKATKKVNVDGVEREVPDVSFPEAGLVSFVLVARTDKDLVGILRGSEKPAKEGGDGGCGLMGPTFPEEAVQKGKVTDLAKQKSSLRVQTSVEAGGDLDRSKVLNGWHCSDGQVAAIREVAWIYGRRGLGGAFSEDAIDYIMRGEVPASLVARATRWFTRKTSDVILPTADILRFPIYDLLVDVANGGRRSGATSICHAANIIASFYDIDGYSPRDMQAPDIALMLKEAALFAARQKILTPEELSALEIQPRRTNLTILVGASGIGKTTILERLEKDKSATILKVKTTRETAGDVGSERESPDVFWGRALQGRYVAAESSYGVDYAILDRDIKEALLKGGPVVVSCGPEMAKVLSERVAQVARGLGLQGAAMVPTVKVVYLQEENDKVLEGHLKTREQHTGRPAADRIKDAKQVAKHLRDKLEPKDPRTLTPTLLPGVQKIMVTATQTEDQTVALVTALLGEATEAPNLKTVKANSPRVELVARKYLRDLIPALQSATLDPTSADTREAGLGTAMRDNYNRFLREVYRAEHGRNPILPHEDVRPDEKGKEDQIQEYRQLKWIVDHVHMVLSAVREGMGQQEASEQDGLPRFGALRSSDTERVERNLSRVREVFASLPSPALADLIVLLHDIGKLGRAGEENLGPSWPHNHEKNSSSLIEKFDLLKDFAGEGSVIKTEEDRVAVELVLRHHHLIGNCFQGAASPELFIELISDPAFVAMVKSKEDPKKSPADSAKERVAFANKVLDWMLFFTIVDVAGQGETGYLSNLRLEYYFSIRDKIGDILKEELGKGTLNGWGAEAAQKIQEFAAAEGPNRLAAVTSPIEGAGLMDTHVQGLDYYGKGWVAPSVEAAISSGAISRDDWKTVIEVFQRMVFPYFDGYLLGGNPAHRLDDVDAAIAHKPAAKVNGNLLKYYALCAQVVKMVNLDKPVEFIMIDKDGNPTTGGAKKVEAATRQTTDGQQAFIDGLNNLFGLDGQGVPTQVTAQGEVEFPLYHRGVKRGNLYTAQGVEGQIDFLVDAKTTRLNAARVVVYVRLPELELTMPGEPK